MVKRSSRDQEPSAPQADEGEALEVSVVMPCLDEAETIERCVAKALGCLRAHGVSGEVLVADNGSTDGSQEIARRAGARVVEVAEKGYGNALMGGFEAARGRHLIMGDADDSYNFADLMPFIEKLREGYDVVMGNRFRGGIAPGAMPWHHKHVGNPVLTGILNVLFRSGIHDAHCGLRALTQQAYRQLNLRTTGMEFASEMVVKAATSGLKMCEVPTTLSADGRSRPPHLRSFRDGWRHLRFLTLLSPRWVMIIPGAVLMGIGVVLGALVAAEPFRVAGTGLDVHTLVAAGLMTIVGYQAITIGLAARIFALAEEIGPPSPRLQRSVRFFTLERGLIAGAVVGLIGLAMIVALTVHWIASGFGALEVQKSLRPMIIGLVLVVIGVQTVLMSLFYSMLLLQRKPRRK